MNTHFNKTILERNSEHWFIFAGRFFFSVSGKSLPRSFESHTGKMLFLLSQIFRKGTTAVLSFKSDLFLAERIELSCVFVPAFSYI